VYEGVKRQDYAMSVFGELADLDRYFSTHSLTSHAPIGAWARFVWWQLRSRLQREILIDWVGGQRLAVQHGMKGATANIYVGLHEFADMMLPLHFLREGDLFFDIGANVGVYTVLASGVCRASTWAFEPDPGTVCHLKRNIELNKLGALVKVYECAVGREQGEIAFTVGLDTVNRIAATDDANVRMTRLEQLDALVNDASPSMIKIDVEGAEEGVLLGGKALLANPSLKVIELETVTLESANILGRNEFERAYYDPNSRRLHRQPIDLKSSNSLFVRDWRFVQERLESATGVEVFGQRI
jgi:FkbM family methyltransferase